MFAFESSPSFAVPTALIDAAVKRNVAYYVSWTEGAEKKLQFEELSYKAKDGEVFQLKEPEQEREIVGPILELSGTKVVSHSRRYKPWVELRANSEHFCCFFFFVVPIALISLDAHQQGL